MTQPDAVTQIINFVRVSDLIGTGGQPTLRQIEALAASGYQLVLNLATSDSDNALPNEGAQVVRLGMDYVQLPVVWRNPTPERFRRFCNLMNSYQDTSAFVHCAMNMRASAFVFLYRVIERHVPIAIAELHMTAVWHPNGIWSNFIDEILESASRDG